MEFNERNKLIEENMGLVGRVIKDRVRNINSIGLYTYDDLFQFGCIGLCKAADNYRFGNGRFSTYAYILIRNEIFKALEYATLRRNRENIMDPIELPCSDVPGLPDDPPHDLFSALNAAQGTLHSKNVYIISI